MGIYATCEMNKNHKNGIFKPPLEQRVIWNSDPDFLEDINAKQIK